MSDFVIDASVAIKWVFLENKSDKAEAVLNQLSQFHVPEHFIVEMDAVITKKVRKRELTAEHAPQKRRMVRKLPFKIMAHRSVGKLAFDLAISLPISYYDALYIATAIEQHAVVHTADERLSNGLKNTVLSDYVRAI